MSRIKEADCMEEGKETVRLLHDRWIIDSFSQTEHWIMLGREQSHVGKKTQMDSIIFFIYSVNLCIFLS